MASKNILKLAAKLSADIGFPVDPKSFRRTYAGRNQRAAGACSWVIQYGQFGCNKIYRVEPVPKNLATKIQLHYTKRWSHVTEMYAVEPGSYDYKTQKET